LEMAKHKSFTVDTKVQVYFCDPQSPWQRGTNENTNGLLLKSLLKSGRITNKRQVTSNVAETMPLMANTVRGGTKCESQMSVIGITTVSG
jgi:IS30 family transposase